MTTNINNLNDAKFQAMDLNFIVKMEPDKLIIETSSSKDDIQYVGEIPANPLIDFEDIKELLEQKIIKIINKNQEMLKIKIGPISLEMLPKPKVEANKLKQLEDSLRDSLQKQADLQQTVNSQKGQITQLKDLVSKLTNTVSRVESNQNAFETSVQKKLDDFKREIIQQSNQKVNEQIVKVQAQFQSALDSKQRLISQNNNRVKIQLQDKLETMKTSVSSIQEKMRNTEENTRADRTQYERMIRSQKDQITRQDSLITGLKHAVQPLIQERNRIIKQKQIDQKLYQKLNQHLERTISNEQIYYGNSSQKYYNKAVSKKGVEEETIKYINYLKQNITPLSPQHYQQLFFLIDLFDSNNKCIINSYYIDSGQQNSHGLAKFGLRFNYMYKRIDLEQFLSFNNWNHLVALSFYGCGWFNDDDWRALVEHAGNFNNLKDLNLYDNEISAIKEGDIEQFKSLEFINLSKLLIKTIVGNPLSEQSQEVLRRIEQKKNEMRIYF